MLKEFQSFILRGNVVDLAVGVVIGAAFGKIVSSLVTDVIMPPIGLLTGGIDFSQVFIDLSGDHHATLAEAKAAGAPVIAAGSFINTVIEFLIIAFAIFIVVKQINRFRDKFSAPPPAAAEKMCPMCVSAIPLAAKKCKFCTADLP